MALLTILALVAALIGTALWYFGRWSEERNRTEYAKRKVKYVPQGNAFLQLITKTRQEEIKHEKIQSEGTVMGFNFLGSYTICVGEPEIAQIVLSKEFTNFTNRRTFEIDDPFFKNALSVVNDEQWKRLRAIVTPTFSSGSLRRMKPLINDTLHTLVKNFAEAEKNGPHVNIKQVAGAFTMDTIVQVAFGTKVDSLVEKDNPIINHAKKLFSVDISLTNIIKFTLVFMTPKLASWLKLRINAEVTDYFDEFATQIIKQKRKEMAANKNFKAQSFIEMLLEAENEEAEKQNGHAQSNGHQNGSANGHTNGVTNGSAVPEKKKYISHQEMISQCVLFFLAGYDTTATTITMASYLLTMHPETQQKLYEEIIDVIAKLEQEAGPDGSKDPIELVTLESLSRFEYLNGVVSETLRLYSPATFIERAVTKDITLETEDGRVHIEAKKGDIIQFPVYSMHRDESQFPEPESFKPERFIGEKQFHKYSYIPFGSGPRNCVARSLALLEAKLALLHTIRLFKFSVCPETKIPPEFYYQTQVIVPKDIRLKIEKRS